MATGRRVVGDTSSEVVLECVRAVNDLIKAAEAAADGDNFRIAAATVLGVKVDFAPPNQPKRGTGTI